MIYQIMTNLFCSRILDLSHHQQFRKCSRLLWWWFQTDLSTSDVDSLRLISYELYLFILYGTCWYILIHLCFDDGLKPIWAHQMLMYSDQLTTFRFMAMMKFGFRRGNGCCSYDMTWASGWQLIFICGMRWCSWLWWCPVYFLVRFNIHLWYSLDLLKYDGWVCYSHLFQFDLRLWWCSVFVFLYCSLQIIQAMSKHLCAQKLLLSSCELGNWVFHERCHLKLLL